MMTERMTKERFEEIRCLIDRTCARGIPPGVMAELFDELDRRSIGVDARFKTWVKENKSWVEEHGDAASLRDVFVAGHVEGYILGIEQNTLGRKRN